MKRACSSFSIILGVVPDAISEWKPDTAPQAMVMNRNGNRLPDHTGPVPSMKSADRRHLQVGRTNDDADAPAP